MLIAKSYSTNGQLASILRGTPVVSGNTATNALNNATFTDADPNGVHAGSPFASVAVGDIVHISGEAAPFTVASITDANNINLTTTIPTQHAGPANFGQYRIFKPDGIPMSSIIVGPFPVTVNGGPQTLIYDELNFTV